MSEESWFKKEVAKIMQLGIPMVITQLFIMGMGFVDTVMAGRYSAEALAGVALGGNVLWPVFMFMSGLTMALTPIVAQLRGGGEADKIGEKVRQGLWIALACGLAMTSIMFLSDPFYRWLGVEPAITQIAVHYLYACAVGLIPAMFYITLRFTAEGLGHTKPPMIVAGSALLLNIPVNYMFIYGKFGAPELGGVGCGVATAAVYWFEFILMLAITRMDFFRQTGFAARFTPPNVREIREVLAVGLPIGASSFVGMMIFSLLGFLIARIGVNELAAHSIAGNLNWLTYVIPMALGSAISIRVGFAVGAMDEEGIRRILKAALIVILVYAVVVTLLLIVFRRQMVSLYTTDADVLAIAATLMLFVAFYQIFDDLLAAFNGALRGFKDTFVPMVISLISYWFVSLPIGYVLAEGLIDGTDPLGVYGYWRALTFGLFLSGICVGLRLWVTTRRELQRVGMSRAGLTVGD